MRKDFFLQVISWTVSRIFLSDKKTKKKVCPFKFYLQSTEVNQVATCPHTCPTSDIPSRDALLSTKRKINSVLKKTVFDSSTDVSL